MNASLDLGGKYLNEQAQLKPHSPLFVGCEQFCKLQNG